MAADSRPRDISGPQAVLPVITASVPTLAPPVWAVLERELFRAVDEGWRTFQRVFCDVSGRLRFGGVIHGRDGADDFYETFFNWPMLYMLGGSKDLLEAAKKHWRATTDQLTDLGLVSDEFECGYDWFHMGESLLFFYGLCAADPDDAEFRERARRFAGLYLPSADRPIYDQGRRMIGGPHTGTLGVREGLGPDFDVYSADDEEMEAYGLPLQDVPGIVEWSDLESDPAAKTMGEAIQRRIGVGDTAVNLAATSLATNAWLYEHEEAYAQWVTEYVGGWMQRAEEAGGILPDNVGPSGQVGELHGGAWYGGHYGWAWPHGYHTVGAAAVIAAINAAMVTEDDSFLELGRIPLRQVLDDPRRGAVADTPMSRRAGWTARLGPDSTAEVELTPTRHGRNGWFDYQPLQLAFPVWIWWFSQRSSDRDILDRIRERSGYDWSAVHQYRDKEEAGHEAPWLTYLAGSNPNYPETALRMALGQVAHRMALIADTDPEEPIVDIHRWQQVNPVVTEILTQLTTGAPQVLYNGGLPFARVRYGDADEQRPGLPPDVSALVDSVDEHGVSLTLVNLSNTATRSVLICGGSYGEHRIESVRYDATSQPYPGEPRSYSPPLTATHVRTVTIGASRFRVVIPPGRSIRLSIDMTLRALRASHQRFADTTPDE